jgi:hypothetical protein
LLSPGIIKPGMIKKQAGMKILLYLRGFSRSAVNHLHLKKSKIYTCETSNGLANSTKSTEEPRHLATSSARSGTGDELDEVNHVWFYDTFKIKII